MPQAQFKKITGKLRKNALTRAQILLKIHLHAKQGGTARTASSNRKNNDNNKY